jgi:hypothetical protein
VPQGATLELRRAACERECLNRPLWRCPEAPNHLLRGGKPQAPAAVGLSWRQQPDCGWERSVGVADVTTKDDFLLDESPEMITLCS